MQILDIIYSICLVFIRLCKWGELQIIKLFISPISSIFQDQLEKLGIVFHFTESQEEGNMEANQLLEKRVQRKCKNYERLVHVNVHKRSEYFVRMASSFNKGNAEAFVDGIWNVVDQDDVAEIFKRIMEGGLYKLYINSPINKFFLWLELYAFNLQKLRIYQIGEEHYDIGNELFKCMLDPLMLYSCAYWKNVTNANLNEAQVAKLELIAKKLDLKPGLSLLDVGCGFGTLCKYLAQNYGVRCVGITISKEQLKYGIETCKGLDVELRLQDYRSLNGEKFDRVVSIGVMEHIGEKNYKEFFNVIHSNLKETGLALIQTIGCSSTDCPRSDLFFHRIFPNGQLPYAKDVIKYTDQLFVLEDWHNFGLDYAKTLRCWRKNFNENCEKLQYGDRFNKMWIYYLCVSEAMFRSKSTSLWQFVLSREQVKWDYRASR